MFQKIFSYFNNKKLESELMKFSKENNFYLFGWGGLNINSKVVSEYGYLLNLVSKGKFTNFNELTEISKKTDELIESCNNELKKSPLWEEKAFNVSKVTAQTNLEELREILKKIDKFLKFISTLGITEKEAYNLSYRYFK